MPRSLVVDPAFDWGDDRPPRRPLTDTVIYEAHVRGLTMGRPDIARPRHLRRASPPTRSSTTSRSLGVTAIELLPIHAFLDEKFLLDRGLRNYWGYMTMGFFAPEPRYMSTGRIAGRAGDGARASTRPASR